MPKVKKRWTHYTSGYSLTVRPFLDDNEHGIFATRAPKRPNAVGISIVKLIRVEGANLEVEDIDIVDGTPLLDIKPYVAEFDQREDANSGWVSSKVHRIRTTRADRRFK